MRLVISINQSLEPTHQRRRLLTAKRTQVDATFARVGGGAKLGALDKALAPRGLAVPTGTNPDTGVGGLTLAGGWGWLARKHGMSVDYLEAVELVTAAGDVLPRVDRASHPELFWALCGGGGNFGVVTSFLFRTVTAPARPYIYTAAHVAVTVAGAVAVARAWRDYALGASRLHNDLAGGFVLPCGAPVVPVLGVNHAGVVDGLEPLATAGGWGGWWPKLGVRSEAVDYHTGLQTLLLDSQQPGRFYECSLSLATLSNEAIDVLVAHARTRHPNSKSSIVVLLLGGEMASPTRARATCVPHRAADVWLLIEGAFEGADERAAVVEWTRSLRASLTALGVVKQTSHAQAGNTDAWRAVYNDDVLERLRAVKREYDPNNVFHLNTNIKP